MSILGEPFYIDGVTKDPPCNIKIGDYFVYSSLLPEATQYSFIYMCYNYNFQGKQIIKFIKMREADIQKINDEIQIMEIVQNPYIIKPCCFFRYDAYMCVVLPYTPQRSILTLITQCFTDGIPEEIAAIFMHQMLQAVNYLHSMNICHRDIKPDNFLVFGNIINPQAIDLFNLPKAVLTDFGFARFLYPGEKSNDFLGTPLYMAPEILAKKPYDKSVDIWGLGVTLYIMLGGLPAFNKLKTDGLDIGFLAQLNKSFDSINLVELMCKPDPNDRITAQDALNNSWITRYTSNIAKTEAESSIYDHVLGLSSEYTSIGGS